MIDAFKHARFAVLCSLCITLGVAGCASKDNPVASHTADTDEQHEHSAHVHPDEGPHQGVLIELGNEQYHAELLYDDQSATIYVLDSHAKQQVPIDVTEIMLNTTVAGQPQQFALIATPDSADPSGKSSRFVSQDGQLAALIHEHTAPMHVVVTIDGTAYRGTVSP